MRRLIAIFLLLIVPLQLGYAAAAAYCQHKTGSAAGHFGHHAHEHRAQVGADQDNGKGKLSLQLDQDCGLCHLQMPQLLPQHTTVTPTSVETSLYRAPVIAYSSADRRRLERPNWTSSL